MPGGRAFRDRPPAPADLARGQEAPARAAERHSFARLVHLAERPEAAAPGERSPLQLSPRKTKSRLIGHYGLWGARVVNRQFAAYSVGVENPDHHLSNREVDAVDDLPVWGHDGGTWYLMVRGYWTQAGKNEVSKFVRAQGFYPWDQIQDRGGLEPPAKPNYPGGLYANAPEWTGSEEQQAEFKPVIFPILGCELKFAPGETELTVPAIKAFELFSEEWSVGFPVPVPVPGLVVAAKATAGLGLKLGLGETKFAVATRKSDRDAYKASGAVAAHLAGEAFVGGSVEVGGGIPAVISVTVGPELKIGGEPKLEAETKLKLVKPMTEPWGVIQTDPLAIKGELALKATLGGKASLTLFVWERTLKRVKLVSWELYKKEVDKSFGSFGKKVDLKPVSDDLKPTEADLQSAKAPAAEVDVLTEDDYWSLPKKERQAIVKHCFKGVAWGKGGLGDYFTKKKRIRELLARAASPRPSSEPLSLVDIENELVEPGSSDVEA